MPLQKYYCDYCDKQFQDTPSARRKHLQSLQHQRAKALWYDSLSHHRQYPLPPRLDKGTCNSFLRTGFCRYGDACRYFHPKQNDQPSGQAIPGSVIMDGMSLTLANLPPSLMPPPEGGYPPLPFIDWGLVLHISSCPCMIPFMHGRCSNFMERRVVVCLECQPGFEVGHAVDAKLRL